MRFTHREGCVWAVARSYLRGGWGLGVHRTQRVANTRYGAHTPLTSPTRAPNPGAMLDFRCSSDRNTTDSDRTEAYSRATSVYNSATVNAPNAYPDIPTTEHFTPLTTRRRTRIEHLAAPRAGSSDGVVHTS